eukprot:5904349-Prymnesium_polylepis.2
MLRNLRVFVHVVDRAGMLCRVLHRALAPHCALNKSKARLLDATSADCGRVGTRPPTHRESVKSAAPRPSVLY